MTFRNRRLIVAAVLCITGLDLAYAQSAVEQLKPLVEVSARRLDIAKRVALSKWDSGTPVEDAAREALVIQGAVKAGEVKGLDDTAVANFFRAQIEANKVVQYSLLADWRREGKAPEHAPIDLIKSIRPELDQLQVAMIADLAQTVDVRASKTCRVDVAKAAGAYLAEHRSDTAALDAVALDRALAATCTM
jgi:chorismate mutase